MLHAVDYVESDEECIEFKCFSEVMALDTFIKQFTDQEVSLKLKSTKTGVSDNQDETTNA